jgi:hypothetical protein
MGAKGKPKKPTIEHLVSELIGTIIRRKRHLFCRCEGRLEDLTDRENQPVVGSLAFDGSKNIYYYTRCLDCGLKKYRPETQVSKAMRCSA